MGWRFTTPLFYLYPSRIDDHKGEWGFQPSQTMKFSFIRAFRVQNLCVSAPQRENFLVTIANFCSKVEHRRCVNRLIFIRCGSAHAPIQGADLYRTCNGGYIGGMTGTTYFHFANDLDSRCKGTTFFRKTHHET